jgi:hypothetical protein
MSKPLSADENGVWLCDRRNAAGTASGFSSGRVVILSIRDGSQRHG